MHDRASITSPPPALALVDSGAAHAGGMSVALGSMDLVAGRPLDHQVRNASVDDASVTASAQVAGDCGQRRGPGREVASAGRVTSNRFAQPGWSATAARPP